MKICRTITEIRSACRESRANGHALGLVATMGALHEGHLSLARAARARCGAIVASIFVNPAQFGPNEDFERYPRTFEADCALLEREGVNLLFAPSVQEMYPHARPTTWVDVSEVGDCLDGASRPGHFRGVSTVVAKLFHIVQPDCAFFGQKDAAQVAVLRAMVRDLNFPVELITCPTQRDADGLAMSSRNRYLTPGQRMDALALSRVLFDVRRRAATMPDAVALRAHMLQNLHAAPGIRVDYAEIVSPDSLLPVADVRKGALVAVAAFLGDTRLIDNVLLEPMA